MTEEQRKGMPLIGDRMPEMEVQTTMGKRKLPDDYKGKWLILFSHPGDFTPVCTTEFVAFAKRFEEFRKLNCELLGLSVDQVFSHIMWMEWIKEKLGVEIPFPVIADSAGKVSEALGMFNPSRTATVRAVFFVDPQGTIRLMLYYPAEIGRNFDEILRIMRAFAVADKNGVAMPANWPDNELIKDEVIIPPANNVKDAAERPKKYQCYDWWFCHKKL
ncbi:MAG: peroxiredoxin [Thermoplasmatota archaeon]